MSITIAIAWRSDWSNSFHCRITNSAGTIGGSHALKTLNVAGLALLLKSVVISARPAWTTGARSEANGQIATETLSGKHTRTSLAGIMAEFANTRNINIPSDAGTRVVQQFPKGKRVASQTVSRKQRASKASWVASLARGS